jgi:DNA polymerase III sliding clamp (beta) subunit (PCNA family)
MTEHTINRRELINALLVCKPALAISNNYAIELTHFWFDQQFVSAYDGRIGIFVPIETPIRGGVPPLLLSWLEKVDGDEVIIEQNDNNIRIEISGSEIDLSVLEESRQILKPDVSLLSDNSMNIPSELVKGLESCLISLDKKSSVPARMGAFFVPDENILNIYSTDAATLCWLTLPKPEGFIDQVIIPPTGFLEQLIELLPGGGEESIFLHDNIIVAANNITGIMIVGNLIECPNMPAFASVCNRNLDIDTIDIPAGFQQALDRLTLSSNPDAIFTIKKDGFSTSLEIKLSSDKIRMKEVIELSEVYQPVSAIFNVSHIKRALFDRTSIGITSRAIVLNGPDNFMHVIAAKGK